MRNFTNASLAARLLMQSMPPCEKLNFNDDGSAQGDFDAVVVGFGKTGRTVLRYLIRNAQKVLNREQILKAVWGYDYYGDTRAVDAVVKRIRKKRPTENVHFSIQSIYGVGYRLGGQV